MTTVAASELAELLALVERQASVEGIGARVPYPRIRRRCGYRYVAALRRCR